MIEAAWLLFVATSLLVIATPGQDMILVMSRSVAQGPAAGVATAAGVSIGLVGHSILATLGMTRITVWQLAGFHDYGEYWMLVAATVGAALVAIVTFGSLIGSMLPFVLRRAGFDPASASAPFVATFVDVTGLVIYFTVAMVILNGTLL